MNIVKRLVVKAFKLDLLAKELARARRTADAQREIIRADRINAQKAADENWELILRMQNSIMAKTTNSPELLRELLRTATVVKENWESALCGGNGGLTHKEMAPFIDALREMKNSVGFAERKEGLMSDRPQDD